MTFKNLVPQKIFDKKHVICGALVSVRPYKYQQKKKKAKDAPPEDRVKKKKPQHVSRLREALKVEEPVKELKVKKKRWVKKKPQGEPLKVILVKEELKAKDELKVKDDLKDNDEPEAEDTLDQQSNVSYKSAEPLWPGACREFGSLGGYRVPLMN